MVEASARSDARLLAAMLTGSWRRMTTAFECTAAELERLAPLLESAGAEALCWRRIKHSNLRSRRAAAELQKAYRMNVLQAALHQRTIERVVSLLRSAGIEPILVKGWAAAGAYPEQGLRPCGDVDLCVRPEQFAAADLALMKLKEKRYEVDLHRGFEKFGGADSDDIYSRSELVRAGETFVRVPCAEDHLRLLSIHMLREGAWRPLWLCDVAAAVESRPANFDWDRCLTSDRRRADWVICALALAHQMLGADVNGTPADERSKPLPKWLIPAILKEWESRLPSMRQRHNAPMAALLRRPSGLWKGLRNRWPNPIEATVSAGGRFDETPRLPLQIGDCLARTAKFAVRLPKTLQRGQ